MTPSDQPAKQEPKAFTGRSRDRKTRPLVKLGDKVSRFVITIGGIGTIIAVLGVCVFLISVAMPLFSSAEVEDETFFAADEGATRPVRLKLDEQVQLAWSLDSEGFLETWRLDSGESLGRRRIAADGEVSAVMADGSSNEVAFGFSDGKIQVGKIEFKTSYLAEDEIPVSLNGLKEGEIRIEGKGIASLTPEKQVRLDEVVTSMDDPFDSGTQSAIHRLDYVESIQGPRLCSLDVDGALKYLSISRKRNLMTGKYRIRSETSDLKVPENQAGRPDFLRLSSLGDQVYLGWASGRVARINALNPEESFVAENFPAVPSDRKLVRLDFLLGRSTLIVGDDRGGVSAWFGTKPDDAETPDGIETRRAHELPSGGAPMSAAGISNRSRTIVTGFSDGGIVVQNVTSQMEILRTEFESGAEIHAVAISPREDAVAAVAEGEFGLWRVDLKHPSATVGSLFTKVWYEGDSEPSHTWQTTAGTDDFESKLGFLPMVFGTLKATFYSLLFGVPIALLAAIFTSEFLNPKTKSRVKPAIEFMASLPSVVLGFLAALVFAPFVEGIVPAVLATFFLVPLTFAFGAFLWQMLPTRTALRFEWARMPLMAICLPLGILIAWMTGPLVESVFFAGDMGSWLDGQKGSALGGWMLLVLPITAVLAVFGLGRFTHPWLQKISGDWTRGSFARFELLRFFAFAVLVFLAAVALSWLISSLGFDPRGIYLGTYIQRNALVVGFAMGFAIIPIIYTIAEDALSSVPTHLRAASLGAGATPWQTATRVIIPTAASGLFSAVMIGLGRAVGETMIVLMAAGNTAIMDANIFNGFRTLAASIAVELPEAVRDGTHYRTLYLAALVLFAITFIINALAELVRQRFRKRAFEL